MMFHGLTNRESMTRVKNVTYCGHAYHVIHHQQYIVDRDSHTRVCQALLESHTIFICIKTSGQIQTNTY